MFKKILYNERLVYLSIIFLIILIYFNPYIKINTMPARGDQSNIIDSHTSDLLGQIALYPIESRKITEEYGQFPFWSPYRLGGTPIFSKPQAVFLYINLPLILFAPTVFAGIKWSILLHFAIAALAMYTLMYYLSKNNLVSFISAFVYTFNGYMVSRLNWGQTNIIYPYAWLPLIFLFTFCALEKKEWLANSILVGVFFSFTVLGGGAQLFLYIAVMYIYFIILYYIINFSFEKALGLLIRIAKMSFIVLIAFFGLTSVFLLPNSDLMNIGVRSQGFSYELSIGGPFTPNLESFKNIFIYPHVFKIPHQDWDSTGLGLFPTLLLIPSLFYARRKKVLLFLLLVPVLLLVFNGSILFYVFWKFIPQYRQVKGIFKGYAILYFVLSILVGYGFMYLLNFTERFKKNTRNLILYSIILLVIINLTLFNNKLTMQTDVKYEVSKNQVLSYIAKDKDIFRFRIYETNGIDWGTDHYSVLLGLNDVYGSENVWLTDYLPIYLSQANQIPAKGYGILNMKYLVAGKELSISGFKFVNKFEKCGFYPNGADICQPKKSDGPYLYQNEKFLPRAYFTKRSIFVVGNTDQMLQIVYFIILNPNYNPSNTVVIHGEGSINQYNDNILKNFDVIILTAGSIDATSGLKLKNYVDGGGILMPNIVQGESTLVIDKINSVLLNLSGNNLSYANAERAKISSYTPNKIVIETENKKGFLTLSEQFSLYPGWSATDEKGNKKAIYRADGVISSVFLDGNEKQITFKYVEPSFFKGALISSITLIFILGYFIYYLIKNTSRNMRTKI